ncbi:MAG TPA: Spy/CpxP family protein refolding chaperone [Stellaceae bacterium]|nr:Spy/CpxP family protein refolding chaperone [Stellaceae bacterium]
MRRGVIRTGRLALLCVPLAFCLALSGWSCHAAPAGPPQAVTLAQAQPTAPPGNVEADITQLRQRMGITPAQEPRFAAVAEIMRENARAAAQLRPPTNPNAVEALRMAIQYGEQDLAGMRRLLPALQALYASLSPAQQRAADMVFRQGPGE